MSKPIWRLAGASVVASVTLFAGAAHAAEPVTLDLSVQTALRDQLLRSAPDGSSAKVDPATGKVVLRVPQAVPASLAATVGRHRGRVVVEPHSGVAIPYSGVVGGHEIDAPGVACNAGFIGYDSEGWPVILTAGHCVQGTYEWRRNGKLLGYAAAAILGETGDMGAIWITHNFTGQPLVNAMSGFALVTRPVRGVQPLPVPTSNQLCKMARVTRYTCGSILAYDVSVILSGVLVKGMLETNICARPGDSGGPLFTTMYVTNPPSALAVGVLSGGTSQYTCSDSRNRTYFQPIQPLLNSLGASLMLAP